MSSGRGRGKREGSQVAQVEGWNSEETGCLVVLRQEKSIYDPVLWEDYTDFKMTVLALMV